MELHLGWKIFFGLFFCVQLGDASYENLSGEQYLALQLKVENLIERIINFIKDYYYQIKTELKCIPECIATNLMATLKSSIDCVDVNERSFLNGKIRKKAYNKNFLKCFSVAKKEVEETINSSNETANECPDEVTEKTYQINVTTTFTKTFHINIRNGVEVIKKKIELDKGAVNCFDKNFEAVKVKNETEEESKEEEEVAETEESVKEEKVTVDVIKDKKEEAKEKDDKHKGLEKGKDEKHLEKKKIMKGKPKEEKKVKENHSEEEKVENLTQSSEEESKEKVESTTLRASEEETLSTTERERHTQRPDRIYYGTPKENLEDVSESSDEVSGENIRKSFQELPEDTEEELRRAEVERDRFPDYEGASDSIYI